MHGTENFVVPQCTHALITPAPSGRWKLPHSWRALFLGRCPVCASETSSVFFASSTGYSRAAQGHSLIGMPLSSW